MAALATAFLLSMLMIDWASAASELHPGLYEVTVVLEMPNVNTTSLTPTVVQRCVKAADLASGAAFGVLGENPIKTCPIEDYVAESNRVTYRIRCRGPNTAKATALFDVTANSFRGVIDMNMGGKNMTMSERQTARWVGKCD